MRSKQVKKITFTIGTLNENVSVKLCKNSKYGVGREKANIIWNILVSKERNNF